MRAIAIDKFGELGSLHDLPKPEPGAGEIRIRVTAAGVNPIDWKTRDGKTGDRPFPLVLGQDVAGIVDAAGDGVRNVSVGDRVFGFARAHGGYADYTIARPDADGQPIATIPDGVSDVQAAALPTPALTALASLEILGVRDGATLLIHGATGGVGAYAAQLARERGAYVIGTIKGGDPEAARSLGVDQVIDTASADPVAAVKSSHPGGVDAVLDLVSTDADADAAFADVLRAGGTLVSTNHVADEKRFEQRGLRAVNVVMNQTPQASVEGLGEVARRVASGALEVRVGLEADLADGADVLERTKAGKVHGKAVLRA